MCVRRSESNYVCAYICMYPCMLVGLFEHIYVRRSVCTYVYMYVCMSESNYACACVGPKVIMYVRA